MWLVWGRKLGEEMVADAKASTPRPLELDRQGNLDETKPLLGSIFGISIFSHICLLSLEDITNEKHPTSSALVWTNSGPPAAQNNPPSRPKGQVSRVSPKRMPSNSA